LLVAFYNGLTLVLSLFCQLPGGFGVGLGPFHQGVVLGLAFGCRGAFIFGLALCHHGGIRWVCCHLVFFSLFFTVPGFGVFGFVFCLAFDCLCSFIFDITFCHHGCFRCVCCHPGFFTLFYPVPGFCLFGL